MSGNGSNGNGTTRDIVAKLWSLCHVLRDDGISYSDYVTELTFLLFLKMLAETGHEERLPKGYRWTGLARREGLDQLEHYRQLLLDLGNPAKTKDQLVLSIFTDAQTKLRKPTNLKSLTDAIDKLDWFSAREEGLGNLYEGLLEKNAAEKKSGAGQYFTPRPLIDCIVRLVKPQAGEVVQDPAAGTAGFLVAADRYIKDRTDDLYKLTEAQAYFQRHSAFVGIELVPDTHRLCLMNLMLHGIESQVENGDSLSPDGERLGKADVILTNPPFGTKKGGGRPTRADFSITADTSNKQLAFVEHVVRALEAGRARRDRRAGQRAIRGWCRSPAAQLGDGPLQPPHHPAAADRHFLRASASRRMSCSSPAARPTARTPKASGSMIFAPTWTASGRRARSRLPISPPSRKPLATIRLGKSPRKDEGEEGRFRFFSREQIAARNDNLDLAWLRDTSGDPEDEMTEPEDLAAAII